MQTNERHPHRAAPGSRTTTVVVQRVRRRTLSRHTEAKIPGGDGAARITVGRCYLLFAPVPSASVRHRELLADLARGAGQGDRPDLGGPFVGQAPGALRQLHLERLLVARGDVVARAAEPEATFRPLSLMPLAERNASEPVQLPGDIAERLTLIDAAPLFTLTVPPLMFTGRGCSASGRRPRSRRGCRVCRGRRRPRRSRRRREPRQPSCRGC